MFIPDCRKFKKIKSSEIAVGDIVEVQVNFTLIPLGNNEYGLKAILREVARFDNTLAMVSRVSIMDRPTELITLQKAAVKAQVRRARTVKENAPKRLKRIIAYTEEEEDDEALLRVKNVKLTNNEDGG